MLRKVNPHIIVTGMVEVVRKEILISLLQVWLRWCVKRSSYHCYRMVEVVHKDILISLLQGWGMWCAKRSSYHCYRYG